VVESGCAGIRCLVICYLDWMERDMEVPAGGCFTVRLGLHLAEGFRPVC
jgi:hypothetical protein